MNWSDIMQSNVFKIVAFIIIRIIIGAICKAIVSVKRYPDSENHGFAWGGWLGIIGLIVCACKSDYRPPKKTPSQSYNYGSGSRTRTSNSYQSSGGYQSNRSYSSNSRAVTKQNFGSKLSTLADSGDVKIQSSEQNKRLASNARTYRSNKKRSFSTIKSGETINVDLSWSENLAELLEATEIVYSNAEMNCNRRLVSERFDYYINLHYRSFTAADLCHAKLEEILPYDTEIRRIISRLNDRNDFLRVDKNTYDQLISLRNTTGDICNLLKQRRDRLNQQTGIIRDKIRDECGQRGKDWYTRLRERAGK